MGTAALIVPSGVSARGSVISSSMERATIGRQLAGVATVTSPAPIFKAAFAGQRRRAGLPERPRDDEDVPVGALMGIRLSRREKRPDVPALDELELQAGVVEQRRRDADGGHDELADEFLGGREDVGDLGRGQGHRDIGADAGPMIFAVSEESPEGCPRRP